VALGVSPAWGVLFPGSIAVWVDRDPQGRVCGGFTNGPFFVSVVKLPDMIPHAFQFLLVFVGWKD
jgi:hypothetical protein